jgi:hypothetical protein
MLLLRGTHHGTLVDAWLDRERPMRFEVGHLTVPLAAAFNAVIYFDRANPMIKAR